MKIISEDKKRFVDVGSAGDWICLYSTVLVRIGNNKKWSGAIRFLETGNCAASDGYVVARQLNLIRDELSKIEPGKVVYDFNDPKQTPPWGDNISPVVTSCGNFFTTADGKDLLYELVSILCYGQIKGVSILAIN